MTPPARTTWKSPGAWILFLAVFAIGLTGDLWSKSAVFDSLGRADLTTKTVIPGVMKFTLSTNKGIVFGLEVPWAIVLIATVVALAAIVYFFGTSPRNTHWTHMALGLIAAGAVGNLYDRLLGDVQIVGRERAFRQVRDFIDFSDIYYNYVFNIADVLLVVGVVMLLLAWIADARRHPKADAAKTGTGQK